MKSYFDCVIIGSGIAGMTAAIYLKRANLNILLLEKDAPGGQMNKSSEIENYPGFSSITGPDLAVQIFEQITKLEVPYRYGNVHKIVCENDRYHIETDMENIETKNIILATGRSPKRLELPNEMKLVGRGISWCAFCDGSLFKGKNVAVIGGGNSALEEALYLSRICASVTLIHRRDTFRADSILQDKVLKQSNIDIIYNAQVTELKEMDGKLASIVVNDTNEIPVSGCFIYIGHQPNSEYLIDSPVILDHGYVIVDNHMRTNLEGIYACGDLIKKEIYQLSTAVGEGTTAAMEIIKKMS